MVESERVCPHTHNPSWTSSHPGDSATPLGLSLGMPKRKAARGSGSAPVTAEKEKKARVVEEEPEEDRNDELCLVCGDGGILVCCDVCPQAFHPKCVPAVNQNDLKMDCWECPMAGRQFKCTKRIMPKLMADESDEDMADTEFTWMDEKGSTCFLPYYSLS